MHINLNPENVCMSDHEVLMKLESILKIDYHCTLADNGKVIREVYGCKHETNIDPEVFSAFCTIYDFIMKAGKYQVKEVSDEKKGMKKLW